MDDDDDDTRRLPSYHHHNTQQLHQIYAQELHQVAAAATAEQKQEQEGAEDEDEDEEEDDEEEDDEEGEEEEEEEVEDVEDAIDDDEEDEDEDEDDDEDDQDQDQDGREQEQHIYEQDFELEQRHKIVGEGLNLSNGFASLAAAGLINPAIAPQQQQQQLTVLGEGPPQQVGLVDIKPGIRDDWTEPATHALLEAWGQRYVQLNKGNLKQEDWEEVALKVSSMSKTHKTDVQCKNRLDTLKKKYKVEKQKQSAIGSSDSKWPFYRKLDQLLCATTKQTGIPGAVDAGHPVKSSAVVDSFRGEHLKGVRKFEAEEILPNNASTCSKSKESPDMTFNSPQPQNADGTESSARKRKAMQTPFKTLAKAITKFGEIYEKMEQSKQQQLMDLEKIRMEFTRDLEMQRMQLFMQTQVELAKMKHGGNDVDATISNLSG